jgi:hypothetical protein
MNVYNSSNPQSLPPGPPIRTLPRTRWAGTLSGPQTPRLLTPLLTTNPGSAPGMLVWLAI